MTGKRHCECGCHWRYNGAVACIIAFLMAVYSGDCMLPLWGHWPVSEFCLRDGANAQCRTEGCRSAPAVTKQLSPHSSGKSFVGTCKQCGNEVSHSLHLGFPLFTHAQICGLQNMLHIMLCSQAMHNECVYFCCSIKCKVDEVSCPTCCGFRRQSHCSRHVP